MKKRLPLAVAALLAVAFVSCGSSVTEEQVGPLEWTAQSGGSVAYVKGYTDLPDYVRLIVEHHDDGTALGDVVVVRGRFVALETIRVGLSVSPTIGPELMERDFLSLPDVVLFLGETNRYGPGVWKVLGSGQMIGVVQPDQTLTFPASETPELLNDGTPVTLESLIEAVKHS